MKTLLPAVLVIGALATSPVVSHADVVALLYASTADALYAADGSQVTGALESDDSSTQPDAVSRTAAAGALLTGPAAVVSPGSLPRYAMLSGGAPMDGSFVAPTVERMGEADDTEFVGSLPEDVASAAERDSPVTEPATLSLLGTGIVSAASLLRRRLGRSKLAVV